MRFKQFKVYGIKLPAPSTANTLSIVFFSTRLFFMQKRFVYTLTLSLMLLCLSPHVQAYDEASFTHYLNQLKTEAAQRGISETTIDNAFATMQFLPKAIELDQKQPEKKISFHEYRQNILTPERIQKGRDMMRLHKDRLEKASKKYGVQPQYIVALWGIETNYGGYKGNWGILSALATLSYEGRRREFFKKELMNALQILDEGHITIAQFRGSWAGAMGHNQFMPSSFLELAVDGDGDGKKDIWNDMDDVFASTANYLARRGWTDEQRWGRQVRLPQGFDSQLVGTKKDKPLAFWYSKGIKQLNGAPIPVIPEMTGAVVAPDGLAGQTFLVYNNYNVLLNWNRSTYFATTVGLLADSLL